MGDHKQSLLERQSGDGLHNRQLEARRQGECLIARLEVLRVRVCWKTADV